MGEIECVIEYCMDYKSETSTTYNTSNDDNLLIDKRSSCSTSMLLAHFNSGLIITLWHPVRISRLNDSSQWNFPHYVADKVKLTPCSKV